MAKPKGTRTSSRKGEEPTKLKQIELTCRVTGKTFHAYDGSLPISPEGWEKLSDEQKYIINQMWEAGSTESEILERVLG